MQIIRYTKFLAHNIFVFVQDNIRKVFIDDISKKINNYGYDTGIPKWCLIA